MEKRNNTTKMFNYGEGSLYFSNKLNSWIFQYYDTNGSRKTMKQRKNESEKMFKKRVVLVKDNLNNDSYIQNSKDTFISILKNYIEQKHIDGITSDRSYCRDLSTIKQLENSCSNFVNKPIANITFEDIEKSKIEIRKYSNTVITKIWTFINKTFKIALARKKISYNIMLDDTLTKPISKRPEQRVESLTVEEEKKLVRILTHQERYHNYSNVLLLQLYTGMRIGEVLALTKDCIDFKNNTLTVYRTLTLDSKYHVIMGEHTKTFKKITGIDNGKRTFPMNDKVLKLLSKIVDPEDENELLFWNYTQNSFITPSEINCYLKRINNKYHITDDSLHTHRLRHTFITRCVEKGINSKVIQSLVGHTYGSSITFNTYTSISTDFIASELRKLG